MKMLALVMPIDWTAKLKSRPIVASCPNSSTRTGNPTVPPPIGVDPATNEPNAIVNAIGQWPATAIQ
jgi:hypothetical protein